MIFHVFTGDLVNSSQMSKSELDAIMAAIHDLVIDVSDWPSGTDEKTIAGFARRGGDAWQVACSGGINALRVALCIQAKVRATLEDAATRIAVANGDGIMPVEPNSAHGAAFTASGQLLETLEDRRLMAHAAGGALDAAFCLADHIAQGWTQAQARALYLKLQSGKIANRVIAEHIGISRQAVDQALAAAGYPAINDALKALDGMETPHD